MKKTTLKKAIVPVMLIVVIVFATVVTVIVSNRTSSNAVKKENTTLTITENNPKSTEPVARTEVVTATDDNGKLVTSIVNVPVDAVTEDNKIASDEVSEILSTTKKATPVTTTKKSEVIVSTTKKVSTPVVNTTKKAAPVTTTKKSSQSEYYPSLTAADMEEVKQYAIDYIRKIGYPVEPEITWDNSTWGGVCGINDNLSHYGDEYKKNGGVSPISEMKRIICVQVNSSISSWEGANGKGSVGGLYPLIRYNSGGWECAVGNW